MSLFDFMNSYSTSPHLGLTTEAFQPSKCAVLASHWRASMLAASTSVLALSLWQNDEVSLLNLLSWGMAHKFPLQRNHPWSSNDVSTSVSHSFLQLPSSFFPETSLNLLPVKSKTLGAGIICFGPISVCSTEPEPVRLNI